MARRLARHGGRPAHGRRAVALVAALCAASSPGTAVAAGPARTPSAEQLRKAYPLETTPPKSRPVVAAPARPASNRKPVQAAKKNGGNLMSNPFVVVVLVLVAVLLCGFLLEAWQIVRRDPAKPADDGDDASGAAAPEAPSERMPSLAILQMGAAEPVAASPSPPPSSPARTPQPEYTGANQGSEPRRSRPSRRFKPRSGAVAGSPPDASREWTAEIEWRNPDGRSHFVVCARPGDGPEVVILRSDSVEWPPPDGEAVADLEPVVRGLKAQLLGAGWTAADAGEAWYAERFAWAPRDSVSDPAVAGPARGRQSRDSRRLGPTGVQ